MIRPVHMWKDECSEKEEVRTHTELIRGVKVRSQDGSKKLNFVRPMHLRPAQARLLLCDLASCARECVCVCVSACVYVCVMLVLP